MKQLSSLSGRRHVFFRGQRRMRALGERLEADELGHFSYYGGEKCFSTGLALIAFLMNVLTRKSIKRASSG